MCRRRDPAKQAAGLCGRRLQGRVTASVAGALIALALSGAATATNSAWPVVAAHPAVVRLREPASVTVSGIAVSSLEVRLAGATAAKGSPLLWRRMQRSNGGWWAALPKPALLGIYPIQLRAGAGTAIVGSRLWLLRVLADGTLARPSFATPEEVARWWVRTRAANVRLVAMKRWPRPAFDRRDPRLHQLLVVAYRPAGDTRVRDRLGIFITAFRNGFSGRWRLLEATVTP